jgi:hypothetical protein
MSWSYETKDEAFYIDVSDDDILLTYDFLECKKPNILIGFTENSLIKFWNDETTALDFEYYKVIKALNS